MFRHRVGFRLAAAITVAGALAVALPGAAQALTLGGVLTGVTSTLGLSNGTSCQQTYTETTPFTPWQDANQYRLAPGGSFAAGATTWSLKGPATITQTTNPYQLSGATGNGELSLGAGSIAVSPFTCVDTSQPTIRFMDAGRPGASLVVSAIFEVSPGLDLTLPLGVLSPGAGWQPSPILSNDHAIPGLLTGGAVPMALELQASGGTATVDDVFLDPRMRY